MTDGKPLSPREREVLVCRCFDDLTLTETGAKLGIKASTADELSTRAFRKLGVRSIRGACARLGLRAAHLAIVAHGGKRVA